MAGNNNFKELANLVLALGGEETKDELVNTLSKYIEVERMRRDLEEERLTLEKENKTLFQQVIFQLTEADHSNTHLMSDMFKIQEQLDEIQTQVCLIEKSLSHLTTQYYVILNKANTDATDNIKDLIDWSKKHSQDATQTINIKGDVKADKDFNIKNT